MSRMENGPEGEYCVKLDDSPIGTHFFQIQDGDSKKELGSIQIMPFIGSDRTLMTIDEICLQTLVSKWMGSINEWEPHLRAASGAGYNMIHFTPLQRRGYSNSPYSIYDHHELDPNLVSGDSSAQTRMEQLARTVKFMESDLKMLSLIDVVWNHASCDSPWLAQHPEAGYNLENTPQLKVAYELDEAILKFSANLESYGLSSTVSSDADITEILKIFAQQVLPTIALWEFFVVDVSRALMELEAVFRREAALSPTTPSVKADITDLSEALVSDGSYNRGSERMNTKSVALYFGEKIEEYRALPNERNRTLLLSLVLAEYRQKLDQLNYPRYQQYDEKVQQIIRNLTTRVAYERLAAHGPRLGPITGNCPLVSTYFTRVKQPNGDTLALANNGWIWNADPLVNFAESGDAYFTREIIVWGDCVKLRYGSAPQDSPWLWDYMTRYTEEMAELFHGFRIDNCHSTPLHVAEYLLAAARRKRPNLYVCAELFTGSEERDMLFVTRLGLHSLIREAMAAWDPAELGRMSVKYGGQPAGSPYSRPEYLAEDLGESIIATVPHALYMDCTHDNETPSQKRTSEDALSNAAIVAVCTAAIGSTRGYDELVPTNLNIVSEQRRYPEPDVETGLWQCRKQLNVLHRKIVQEGLYEINVRQYDDLLEIERTNPHTMEGITLLTRTAFTPSNPAHFYEPIKLDGCEVNLLFGAKIHITGAVCERLDYITTTPADVEIYLQELAGFVEIHQEQSGALIQLEDFPPGAILVLTRRPIHKVQCLPLSRHAIYQRALELIATLDLYDLNIFLYRCAAEENDGSRPLGTYVLPGYGALVYAGLQGFMSVIRKVSDAHHPLCVNVREGDWALQYIWSRLYQRENFPRLVKIGSAIKELADEITKAPSSIKPRLFIELVSGLYERAIKCALEKLALFPSSSKLVQMLALTSVQLIGSVPSTGLYPASIDACMSAGLPHFSTHHMRCWGRDIFISLAGLMLRTGRFVDAKRHILAFAACHYRGLIPNLLDSARRPRYNARDATWFFLYAVQRYCQVVEPSEAKALLNNEVPLRFPNDVYVDFDDPTIFTRTRPLKLIIQDIMQAHASGISFREWNAGPQLDPVMQDAGFNIRIELDVKTGFIMGGNAFNCGTWMDKMGESERAGNRGIPATPRDGAPVELVALLDSTLSWLIRDKPTEHVSVNVSGGELSYQEWQDRLRSNFERHFYIPTEADDDANIYKINPELVRHREMYKDTVGGTDPACDYQLRPNMLVAMAISPSLFDRQHAVAALRTAECHLTGPLGMRTLSPVDPAYRPDYDNSDDSSDTSIARGFNYHQGPEWVWLFGCYLSAWHHFCDDPKSAHRLILRRLQPHYAQMVASDWAGLVELTNLEGTECKDSCATQAWSMATILDALLSL